MIFRLVRPSLGSPLPGNQMLKPGPPAQNCKCPVRVHLPGPWAGCLAHAPWHPPLPHTTRPLNRGEAWQREQSFLPNTPCLVGEQAGGGAELFRPRMLQQQSELTVWKGPQEMPPTEEEGVGTLGLGHPWY